jgi:hypothetical protein
MHGRRSDIAPALAAGAAAVAIGAAPIAAADRAPAQPATVAAAPTVETVGWHGGGWHGGGGHGGGWHGNYRGWHGGPGWGPWFHSWGWPWKRPITQRPTEGLDAGPQRQRCAESRCGTAEHDQRKPVGLAGQFDDVVDDLSEPAAPPSLATAAAWDGQECVDKPERSFAADRYRSATLPGILPAGSGATNHS